MLAGKSRRPQGGGACCGRSAVVLLVAVVVAIPLASVISFPLAIALAPQYCAATTTAAVAPATRLEAAGTRKLRSGRDDGSDGAGATTGAVVAAAAAPTDALASVAVFGALPGEGIRLEAVDVDIAVRTRHYVSFCDATLPAEFHLRGLAAYERPPRVHFRAPHPEAPVTCAAGRMFMVDMRDEAVADDLLDYMWADEPWNIELWVGILTADRCRKVARATVGPHACRANWRAVAGAEGKKAVVLDFG